MCVQYWPAGKNKEDVYSGVGVMVEHEEQIANFMIRTIRLRKVIISLTISPLAILRWILFFIYKWPINISYNIITEWWTTQGNIISLHWMDLSL